jgi:O-antigen/teichoic acid export membrane protein
MFRAVSQVATIVGFIVLVRAMPEHDFGVFNLLYAFIPMLSTVASLGLEQTMKRYQPEYLRAGNIGAARWLVRFVASARFGTNVVLLAVILLTWNYVAPIFKLTPYRGEFALFCLLILLHFQARILQLSLAANMLHRFSVGSFAVLSILKLPIYAGLAWFHSLTLTTAILADTVAFSIAYLFLLRAYRHHCPTPAGISAFRPDAPERKRLFRYGLLNNFNDAGAMILSSKSDTFFIAAFLDPIGVGIYAFYMRLNQMNENIQPMRLFDKVIQPVFFAVPQSEAEQKVPKYFSLLLNVSLMLQWPVLAYSIVYHAEIVAFVFGGKFGDHSALLPLIVAIGTLGTIAEPVTLVAQYEEKAGAILLSKMFAIYNVIALIVLIPIAGLVGAVIATGSAALFKNLFIWWHVRQRARWLNAVSALIIAVALWGAAVAACLALKSAIALPPAAHLAVGLLVSGIAFLVYIRTPAVSASDRKILASVLHGREARLLRIVGLLR